MRDRMFYKNIASVGEVKCARNILALSAILNEIFNYAYNDNGYDQFLLFDTAIVSLFVRELACLMACVDERRDKSHTKNTIMETFYTAINSIHNELTDTIFCKKDEERSKIKSILIDVMNAVDLVNAKDDFQPEYNNAFKKCIDGINATLNHF